MKAHDVNKGGRLTHMIAADLFYGSSTKQVFSAKTGKWLGAIHEGQEINFTPHEETEEIPQPEPQNKAQLSLF